MDVDFTQTQPGKPEPVRIEQVFAEKPGGGLVKSAAYDIPPTTAVGEKDGVFQPIRAFRLVKAVVAADTKIQIEKGSGIAKGDVIGHGAKAVACTAVSTTNEAYDEVTAILGVDIPAGATLFEAAEASADAAEPKLKPVYVTGNLVPANSGDFPVRLINGANLRKETACIAGEVAALLPMINLV